jgi:hypothetical protein
MCPRVNALLQSPCQTRKALIYNYLHKLVRAIPARTVSLQRAILAQHTIPSSARLFPRTNHPHAPQSAIGSRVSPFPPFPPRMRRYDNSHNDSRGSAKRRRTGRVQPFWKSRRLRPNRFAVSTLNTRLRRVFRHQSIVTASLDQAKIPPSESLTPL